jgi:hypothetical protein
MVSIFFIGIVVVAKIGIVLLVATNTAIRTKARKPFQLEIFFLSIFTILDPCLDGDDNILLNRLNDTRLFNPEIKGSSPFSGENIFLEIINCLDLPNMKILS